MTFTVTFLTSLPHVNVYVLCVSMVVVVELPALQDGADVIVELQDTPGPVTEHVVPLPGTFVALQVRVEDCPARNRLGEAVIERVGVPAVHHPAATFTVGHCAGADAFVAATCIPKVPALEKVRLAVCPVP